MPDRTPIEPWAKISLWAGYVYLLLILIFAEPVNVSPPITLLGIGLVFLGTTLRMVAASASIKDEQFCTSGIYAITRNPHHFGSFLAAIGFVIIAGRTAWIFIPFLLFILMPIYYQMIRLEEEYLEKLLPNDFPGYRLHVPRFVPVWSELDTLTRVETKLDWPKLRENGELWSAILLILTMILTLAIHPTWVPWLPTR